MLDLTIKTIQRREGGRILAGLIRLTGNFEMAEDALQEAYLRALSSWPKKGLPDNPAAWLTRVAQRVWFDRYRGEQRLEPLTDDALALLVADENSADENHIVDDQLRLIFTCCHPALVPAAQAGLALKTICQLSVAEIARAYLEPEATTGQRLVRAKRKIAEAKIAYEVPSPEALPARLETVLRVIYLVFNAGYTASHANQLIRADLCMEAIRLCQLVNTLLPNQAEAMGLAAMMQFNHARRNAREDASGDLIPLDEQDRSLWNKDAIHNATRLLDNALQLGSAGAYQIEAAIAALHCTAPTAADTDWAQISALYGALWHHRPTDVVALNAAVAHAMAFSLDEGLARIEKIAVRGELTNYHLLYAARADLLRRNGCPDMARTAYENAIALCENQAEKRYLEKRLQAL
jgi:RNA polymerase sigma-70 factor, ECF subfamily